MNQHLDPETIIANAQKLIDRVKSELAEGAQFFERHGLNREKSLAALQEQMGGKQIEELKEIMRDDHEVIEQEVHEEMARLGLTATPPKPQTSAPAQRMRRTMI